MICLLFNFNKYLFRSDLKMFNCKKNEEKKENKEEELVKLDNKKE